LADQTLEETMNLIAFIIFLALLYYCWKTS